MTEKRFRYDNKTVSILKDGEFWLDGTIDTACNHSEICNELNEQHEQIELKNKQIGNAKTIIQEQHDLLNDLNDENEHYKSIFFELVETALTDKNCRELYCKGILGIFDKANSLNQARDMIKEFLE